jgi:hypothetical protein
MQWIYYFIEIKAALTDCYSLDVKLRFWGSILNGIMSQFELDFTNIFIYLLFTGNTDFCELIFLLDL